MLVLPLLLYVRIREPVYRVCHVYMGEPGHLLAIQAFGVGAV